MKKISLILINYCCWKYLFRLVFRSPLGNVPIRSGKILKAASLDPNALVTCAYVFSGLILPDKYWEIPVLIAVIVSSLVEGYDRINFTILGVTYSNLPLPEGMLFTSDFPVKGTLDFSALGDCDTDFGDDKEVVKDEKMLSFFSTLLTGTAGGTGFGGTVMEAFVPKGEKDDDAFETAGIVFLTSSTFFVSVTTAFGDDKEVVKDEKMLSFFSNLFTGTIGVTSGLDGCGNSAAIFVVTAWDSLGVATCLTDFATLDDGIRESNDFFTLLTFESTDFWISSTFLSTIFTIAVEVFWGNAARLFAERLCLIIYAD